MRLLYKNEHEGVWFSRNGHRAWLRGERPKSMWPEGHPIRPTVKHHIAKKRRRGDYSRELVMFFEENV